MAGLVSCLTVAAANRWGFLQRAVLDFLAQTYAERELIIVAADADYVDRVADWLQSLPAALEAVRVKPFCRPARDAVAGYLHAAAQARGDYLAWWPDDCRNAPERLAAQMDRQRHCPGQVTYLGVAVYLFHETAELFVVHYDQGGGPLSERCAASTMIAPRDLLPALEPHLRPDVPTAAARQMASPYYRRPVRVLYEEHLYHHAVGVTDDSPRGYDEHRRLATTLPRSFPRAMLLHRQVWVTTTVLDTMPWDGPLEVMGPDGLAFVYKPQQTWAYDLFPTVTGSRAARPDRP